MVVLSLIIARTISVAFFTRAHLLIRARADVEKLGYCQRSLILKACVEDLQHKRQKALCATLCYRFDLREQVDAAVQLPDLCPVEVGDHLRVANQKVLENLDEDYCVSLGQAKLNHNSKSSD